MPRSLKRKSEFKKVYEEGHKLVSRSLVIYRLPAEDSARAVVASRKIGGAVKRNRAKRLLREALRRIDPALTYNGDLENGRGESNDALPKSKAPGLWIVAVARKDILSCDIHDLESELKTLLSGRRTSRDPSRHDTPET